MAILGRPLGLTCAAVGADRKMAATGGDVSRRRWLAALCLLAIPGLGLLFLFGPDLPPSPRTGIGIASSESPRATNDHVPTIADGIRVAVDAAQAAGKTTIIVRDSVSKGGIPGVFLGNPRGRYSTIESAIATTDADGRAVVDATDLGAPRLIVAKAGYRTTCIDHLVPGTVCTVDLDSGVSIRVACTASGTRLPMSGVTLVASRSYVDARNVGESMGPDQATICCDEDWGIHFARTDPNGFAVFSGLVQGKYLIECVSQSYAPKSRYPILVQAPEAEVVIELFGIYYAAGSFSEGRIVSMTFGSPPELEVVRSIGLRWRQDSYRKRLGCDYFFLALGPADLTATYPYDTTALLAGVGEVAVHGAYGPISGSPSAIRHEGNMVRNVAFGRIGFSVVGEIQPVSEFDQSVVVLENRQLGLSVLASIGRLIDLPEGAYHVSLFDKAARDCLALPTEEVVVTAADETWVHVLPRRGYVRCRLVVRNNDEAGSMMGKIVVTYATGEAMAMKYSYSVTDVSSQDLLLPAGVATIAVEVFGIRGMPIVVPLTTRTDGSTLAIQYNL